MPDCAGGMMPKHKHADLMLLYAQDAAKTDEPWELWEYMAPRFGNNPIWVNCHTQPSWDYGCQYRRIPEKTDLEKYGVQKGDVWSYRGIPTTIKDANVGSDSVRCIHRVLYPKSGLTTLLFRYGIVDKL